MRYLKSVWRYFPALAIALLIWFECSRTVLAQAQIEEVQTEQSLTRQSLTEQSSIEQSLAQQLPYKYCGHCLSHKFHRLNCPFGMCISKKHLVLFRFRKEAIEAHYVPCKYCLPAVWWSVHGVILPRQNNILQNQATTEKDIKNTEESSDKN